MTSESLSFQEPVWSSSRGGDALRPLLGGQTLDGEEALLAGAGGLLVDLPFEGLHSMSRGWGLGAQAGMVPYQQSLSKG